MELREQDLLAIVITLQCGLASVLVWIDALNLWRACGYALAAAGATWLLWRGTVIMNRRKLWGPTALSLAAIIATAFFLLTIVHVPWLYASLAALAIYFLPTVIAYMNKCVQKDTVFVINLFLGWTFVGWVMAMIFASWRYRRMPRD